MGIRAHKEIVFILHSEQIDNIDQVMQNIEDLYQKGYNGDQFLQEANTYDPDFYNIYNLKGHESILENIQILHDEYFSKKVLKENTSLITFSIPGYEEMKRYNNIIDHYEISTEGKIEYRNHDLYPYTGKKVSAQNFQIMDKEDAQIINLVNNGLNLDDNETSKKTKEKLETKYQFNFNEKISHQYYTEAPSPVRLLAEKIGVKKKDLNKIRLAILEYWC